MTKTIDPGRSVTIVGGRLPLYYLQDGHGFDRARNYLGEYDDNGNRLGDSEPLDPVVPLTIVTTPAAPLGADSAGEGDDDQAGKEGGDEGGAGQSDEQAGAGEQSDDSSADDAVAEAPYKGVRAAQLKRHLEDRGIDIPANSDRDALVALLVADDAKGGAGE